MARIPDSRTATSWTAFVDEIYRLNPGVLPPKSMVTDVRIHVAPGGPFPVLSLDIIGLRMPGLPSEPVIIGENGVE